jgi:hypothetical protein
MSLVDGKTNDVANHVVVDAVHGRDLKIRLHPAAGNLLQGLIVGSPPENRMMRFP